MSIQVGLTQMMKSEIRGMRDDMQVFMFKECKRLIHSGLDMQGNPLTAQQRQSLADTMEFLHTIFVARVVREYKRKYHD